MNPSIHAHEHNEMVTTSDTPLAFAVGIELAPPAKRGQALALVVSGLNVATYWSVRNRFQSHKMFVEMRCGV